LTTRSEFAFPTNGGGLKGPPYDPELRPPELLCDVENRFNYWDQRWNSIERIRINNLLGSMGPFDAETHRDIRFERDPNRGAFDPGAGDDINEDGWFEEDEFFHCRRPRHQLQGSLNSGHCTVCREKNFVKVHGWEDNNLPARTAAGARPDWENHFIDRENTAPFYQLACYECHKKATKRFPDGHGPKLMCGKSSISSPRILTLILPYTVS